MRQYWLPATCRLSFSSKQVLGELEGPMHNCTWLQELPVITQLKVNIINDVLGLSLNWIFQSDRR